MKRLIINPFLFWSRRDRAGFTVGAELSTSRAHRELAVRFGRPHVFTVHVQTIRKPTMTKRNDRFPLPLIAAIILLAMLGQLVSSLLFLNESLPPGKPGYPADSTIIWWIK